MIVRLLFYLMILVFSSCALLASTTPDDMKSVAGVASEHLGEGFLLFSVNSESPEKINDLAEIFSLGEFRITKVAVFGPDSQTTLKVINEALIKSSMELWNLEILYIGENKPALSEIKTLVRKGNGKFHFEEVRFE